VNYEFAKICEASASYNERSDCVVKAISITCEMGYDKVHAMVKSKGRKNRCGVKLVTKIAIFAELTYNYGFDLITFVPKRQGKRQFSQYTMATIGKAFPKGRYLISVRGHMAAMVDGEILDWTAGRRHRVITLTEVIKRD